MKLIAGLGNPGKRYEGTRHNVGFDVVRRILDAAPLEDRASESDLAWARVRLPVSRPTAPPPRPPEDAGEEAFSSWREAKRAAREAQEEEPVLLATPLAFMNRSGPPIKRLLDENAVSPEGDLLVVVDDIDLDVGRLRLRREGSSGGHLGLASIEEALGTQKWARLRVGVGRNPEGVRSEDWVLERPFPEEAPALQEGMKRAAECARAWLARGIDRAMDEFNRGPERSTDERPAA
ncbi:peptidyl-tRNA hydrolase [bacterium]|nr:peptidyl-tRNA hydrolase [bacterium]